METKKNLQKLIDSGIPVVLFLMNRDTLVAIIIVLTPITSEKNVSLYELKNGYRFLISTNNVILVNIVMKTLWTLH